MSCPPLPANAPITTSRRGPRTATALCPSGSAARLLFLLLAFLSTTFAAVSITGPSGNLYPGQQTQVTWTFATSDTTNAASKPMSLVTSCDGKKLDFYFTGVSFTLGRHDFTVKACPAGTTSFVLQLISGPDPVNGGSYYTMPYNEVAAPAPVVTTTTTTTSVATTASSIPASSTTTIPVSSASSPLATSSSSGASSSVSIVPSTSIAPNGTVVTIFVPVPVSSSVPNSAGGTSQTGSHTNLALIIALAVVILLLMVAMIWLVRRRRQRKQNGSGSGSSSTSFFDSLFGIGGMMRRGSSRKNLLRKRAGRRNTLQTANQGQFWRMEDEDSDYEGFDEKKGGARLSSSSTRRTSTLHHINLDEEVTGRGIGIVVPGGRVVSVLIEDDREEDDDVDESEMTPEELYIRQKNQLADSTSSLPGLNGTATTTSVGGGVRHNSMSRVSHLALPFPPEQAMVKDQHLSQIHEAEHRKSLQYFNPAHYPSVRSSMMTFSTAQSRDSSSVIRNYWNAAKAIAAQRGSSILDLDDDSESKMGEAGSFTSRSKRATVLTATTTTTFTTSDFSFNPSSNRSSLNPPYFNPHTNMPSYSAYTTSNNGHTTTGTTTNSNSNSSRDYLNNPPPSHRSYSHYHQSSSDHHRSSGNRSSRGSRGSRIQSVMSSNYSLTSSTDPFKTFDSNELLLDVSPLQLNRQAEDEATRGGGGGNNTGSVTTNGNGSGQQPFMYHDRSRDRLSATPSPTPASLPRGLRGGMNRNIISNNYIQERGDGSADDETEVEDNGEVYPSHLGPSQTSSVYEAHPPSRVSMMSTTDSEVLSPFTDPRYETRTGGGGPITRTRQLEQESRLNTSNSSLLRSFPIPPLEEEQIATAASIAAAIAGIAVNGPPQSQQQQPRMGTLGAMSSEWDDDGSSMMDDSSFGSASNDSSPNTTVRLA